MIKRVLLFLNLFLPSFLLASSAEAFESNSKTASQSSYQLKTSVIGSSGVSTTSAGFQAIGILGQSTPIGIGRDTNRDLYAGFWNIVWMQTATAISVPIIYMNTLFQNHPNPFNPTTTIEYEMGMKSKVDISIYNVMGQRIRQLINRERPPGHYEAIWDGMNERGESVASGIYFYRIRIGRFSAVKKMVLLK